jgi:hypothetical protein
MHAQRMGTSNIPIRRVLMEIFGRTVDVFLLVLEGKKNTLPPWHGGRRHPMAATVPRPRRRHTQQSVIMMCDKSMSLKLEDIIVYAIY